MSILVTGAAGFVGSHASRALLARGETVIGVDNFSDYYDPDLKIARLKTLLRIPADCDHLFRLIATTCSGRSRPG